MRKELRPLKRIVLLAVSAVLVAGIAGAQNNRIRTYRKALEKSTEKELAAFQASMMAIEVSEQPEANEETSTPVVRRRGRRGETRSVMRQAESAPERALEPFEYVVIVGDSQDVDGQDVEIRITMPIDAFMEFAPIAALEAAAVPHKFPVGFIYLREETTDRIARVAFVDAEPIAGRYLAGDEAAIQDMNEALIWH